MTATGTILLAGAGAEPVAWVALALAVVLAGAKVWGALAERVRQPPVLGELLFGVILGNAGLAGIPWFEWMKAELALDVIAQLGVVVLLFEVGLESTVRDMLRVGLPSLLVAVVGVAAPFALGWGLGALLIPERSIHVHLFLGAALTATSVGITARVLQDLGRSQSPEARVILGAAVIDDVLGLVILAAVAGVIRAADGGSAMSVWGVIRILLQAVLFLVGAVVLGLLLSPFLFRAGGRLKARGVLLATSLSFCFLLSFLSAAAGLAAIVGAYAAGLVLEDGHYREVERKEGRRLLDLVAPLVQVLGPVFFVLMGMRVDLSAFGSLGVIGAAALLTAAAVIGKLAAGLGATGRGLDRLSIGIGMVPRGEVGLIFAGIGRQLTLNGEPVVDAATYSAVVIMVIFTTLLTPPALRFSLSRRRPGEERSASVEEPLAGDPRRPLHLLEPDRRDP